MSGDLDLLDELLRIVDGTPVTAVDVTMPELSVRIRRRAIQRAAASVSSARAGDVKTAKALQVKSPAVGIFNAEREWKVGDAVARGALLGGVQSLGHVAEITAPVDGAIRDVLTPSGAPVEYGQPLFAVEPI